MGYRTVALSSSGSKKDFAHKLGANDYIDGSKEKHSEALQKLGGAALIVRFLYPCLCRSLQFARA